MLLRSAVCLSLAVGLEIHEPAHLAGEYPDTPASFAPANYDVNALAAVATSCPCEWEVRDVTFAHPLVNGRILLVHDGVCTGSCPAQAAACAAQLANASGILVPESFNPESLLFNEESAAAGDYVAFDAEQNASCDEPIPTAYVSVNASKDLVGFALQVHRPSHLSSRIPRSLLLIERGPALTSPIAVGPVPTLMSTSPPAADPHPRRLSVARPSSPLPPLVPLRWFTRLARRGRTAPT